MKPLVSVIITAFNRADTIERAVASARAQSWGTVEIVVVDDASTDDTVAVVEALGGDDLRIVRNASNRGIGGAKNVGVLASSGEFIAFLDSDDEWLPEKLALQMQLLTAPDAPPLAFCAFYVTRGSGADVVRTPQKGRSWLESTLCGITVSLGSTLVARRDLFDQVGLFNEGIRRMQDRDWILRYLDIHSEFLVEPTPLARIHNTGFPAASTVIQAGQALMAANRDRIARHGGPLLRLFEASLRFEVAVALYREGARLPALREAIAACLHAPALVPTAFGRLSTKLRDRDLA